MNRRQRRQNDKKIKSVIKKVGFPRPEEMEQYINMKAEENRLKASQPKIFEPIILTQQTLIEKQEQEVMKYYNAL